MTYRISCCVPFCRRTRKPDGHPEWICGKHWAAVPRRLRARKKKNAKFIRREIRRNPKVREYWMMPAGSRERLKAIRMWRLSDAIWEACKRAAVESAAGIQ